jgi:oligopeptide transport system substrate-binding protein
MRRVICIVVVLAVAAALHFSNRSTEEDANGRKGPTTRPAQPAPEQVFRFNNGAEPETLDPALMTGVPEHQIALALFEGLVSYHPKTLRPVPGVAESWTISKDGLTYTFKLRKARWSNKVRVTSADFVYAWRRVLEPATAAEYAYQLWYVKNARAYTRGEVKDFNDVGIRALKPDVLEIVLEHPTAFFLDLLAFETFMPVPRPTVEKFGDKWTRPENIVTNGPFMLKEWKLQEKIVMERSPFYWDAKNVKLDRIEAYPINNTQTALMRYQSGELDWINSLPAPRLPKLKDDPHYYKAPYLGIYFYRFNCTKKPFDDARVRKAFNLALDKAKLCKYVLNGQYDPAATFVPPMLPPYESPKGMDRDVARAKKLLAEAGYPGGKGFPRVRLLYNTSKQHEQIAVVAQNMWKETLGVDVTLENQEWKVYLKTTSALDYDIARSAWIGDYMDPNTFLDMFVTNGGNNRTGWSHPKYDELIADAAATPDMTRRLELLQEAEGILINEEMPVMPVYYYSNLSLRRPEVKGFYSNPRDLHPFKYIYIGAPPVEMRPAP